MQYACHEEDLLETQAPPVRQDPGTGPDCGTHPFTPEELSLMQDPDGEFQQLGNEFLKSARISKIRIPIRAHVLRKTDKSGGISVADIEASLDRVNVHYRPMDIEFYVDRYNYLDNTTDYNAYLDSDEESRPLEDRLAKNHKVGEAINVFFFQNSSTSWAYGFASGNDWMVMNNGHTRNPSTFSHELGHYFGLPHTHAEGDELVKRTNCTTAGDRFCDTPADPENGFTAQCGYNGTSRDANGDTYAPLTNNLMSYAFFQCRDTFTAQQRNRILYTYIYRTQYKNKTPIIFYDRTNGFGKMWHFSQGIPQDNPYYAQGWRKDWHTMATFEEAGKSYILMYARNIGHIQIYRLRTDGKLGTQEYNRSGFSDWDIVQSYEQGDQPYVLFYNRQTGRAEIRAINDGKLSSPTQSTTWSTGWDMIRTFQQGDTPYALFYNRQVGRGYVYTMSSGRLGSNTHSSNNWRKTWDIIETFEEGSTPHAVFYDQTTGVGEIYDLSGGQLRGYVSSSWQKTWDMIVPFHEYQQPYLFFYDSNLGHGKVYEVRNRKLSSLTYESQTWSTNWSIVTSY